MTRLDAVDTDQTQSSKTPYDEDFFVQQDKMGPDEHSAILGLAEFENSLKFFHEKKYEQSELQLKQALKILKTANHDASMSYLFLLKRLANVCFLGRKYADAEKFYKVAVDLVPKVTKNPAN